jgi:23S rRNA (cytidine1920-2'-O)/16S rRNA (cytidine1409-2'-O)-methyltransferase
MAGQILVDDSPATKAGANVAEFNNIRIRGEVQKYVSRGGVKLEGALKAFDVLIKDKIALDVGASTGGFSDCLLQSGVAFIYAVDVGHSQLDWKIRSDSRVKVFEKYNAKNLSKSDFDKKIDLVVVDVSFISLQKVFAPIKRISTPETDWITLIKPQFEVGKR